MSPHFDKEKLAIFHLLFFTYVCIVSCITIEEEPKVCGQNEDDRRAVANFQFSNGNVNTTISKYPWTVLIMKYDGVGFARRPEIHCGGSLISTKHVLTASHCLNQRIKEDLLIVVGAEDPFSSDLSKQGQSFSVKDFEKHSNYKNGKVYFDVAIIELSRSVEIAFDIQPICIPKMAVANTDDLKNFPSVISGYGSATGKRSSIIHYASLTIIENDECQEKHYDDLEESNLEIDKDLREKVNLILDSEKKISTEIICTRATIEDLGTCPGDSGGPLIIEDEENNRHVQVGVVYGSLEECSDRKFPSLYARLHNYDVLSFIRNITFGDIIEPVEVKACQEGGPCQNGGTCTRSGLGYNCRCKLFEDGSLQNLPSFFGTNCEKPLSCINNQCKNNATCYVENSNPYETKCRCKPGFSGPFCVAATATATPPPPTPKTTTSPCQEGGPCQNGGTCTRSGLGYNCKCKLFEKGPLQNIPAFSGTNCETPLFCINNPCKNNATCYVENSNPYETKCRCKPGFSGPFCVAATATVTTTTATTTTPKTTTTISNVGDETNKATDIMTDCGKESARRGGSSQHVTGIESNTIDQPWSVAIVLPKNNDSDLPTKLHCSGSILDETTILTAAHCFLGEYPEDRSKMTIIVGSNQPTDEGLLKKRRRFVARRKIKSVKIHPLYDKVLFSAKYDLALVKIEGRSFRFKQSIWPICIPGEVRQREYHFGKGYRLVGYGKDINNPELCDDFECLKEDRLNALPTEYCSAIYGRILSTPFDPFHELIKKTLPRNFDEEDSLLCAGIPGQNAGTCPGDSGGILMTTSFDHKKGFVTTQQAVVHGSRSECDGSRYPSIFVRLDDPEVLPWIFENVFPEFPKPDSSYKKKKK